MYDIEGMKDVTRNVDTCLGRVTAGGKMIYYIFSNEIWRFIS